MFGRKNTTNECTISESEVNQIIDLLGQYSSLNLKNQVHLNPSNETTSKLVESFTLFHKNLSQSITELSISSESVHNTCVEIEDKASDMRQKIFNTNELTHQASQSTNEINQTFGTVAAATEELNISMKDISATANQSKEAINSIALNTDKLTHSAQEVLSNTSDAQNVSAEAISHVSNISNKVSSLEIASNEINAVTDVISDISEQTKLLALNATIEAARAGDAGKGFAVVAKEVKNLALQTSNATHDIQSKIKHIQEATSTTSSAIQEIIEVIQNMDSMVKKIAKNSDTQAIVTESISTNILEANSQIDEMSNNLEQGALAVEEISGSISLLTQHTHSINKDIKSINHETSQIQNLSTSIYASSIQASNHGHDAFSFIQSFSLSSVFKEKVDLGFDGFVRLTPRYDVKVKQYNDDHEVIFVFINDIQKLVKVNSPTAPILDKMKQLAQFTQEHFSREEEEFVKTNYSQYESHKAIHNKLLSKIKSIISDISEGKPVDLIEVLQFLRDWLYNHIETVDQQYSDFLNSKGVY